MMGNVDLTLPRQSLLFTEDFELVERHGCWRACLIVYVMYHPSPIVYTIDLENRTRLCVP